MLHNKFKDNRVLEFPSFSAEPIKLQMFQGVYEPRKSYLMWLNDNIETKT